MISENWHGQIWKRCLSLRQNVSLVQEHIGKILMQQWLCRTAKHVRKKAHKWDLSAIRSTRIQMNHQKVSKDVHPTSVSVNLTICLTRLFPQEGGWQCLKIKLHLFCGEKKAPALLLCRTPLAGMCGCSIYQALGFWAQTKLITVPPSALVCIA